MFEIVLEPVELRFEFYFPPGRPGVARLHDTGCWPGRAHGRTRSDHWSTLTWDSEEAAHGWAEAHRFTVEHCRRCLVSREAA
jgi:hypothetical protein